MIESTTQDTFYIEVVFSHSCTTHLRRQLYYCESIEHKYTISQSPYLRICKSILLKINTLDKEQDHLPTLFK